VQVEVIQDLIFVLDEEFHSRTKLDRGWISDCLHGQTPPRWVPPHSMVRNYLDIPLEPDEKGHSDAEKFI
jgi:hypothetical protein